MTLAVVFVSVVVLAAVLWHHRRVVAFNQPDLLERLRAVYRVKP